MPFLAYFLHIKKMIIIASMVIGLTLSGCGKKGPLYIPTAEQKAKMAQEQAERDAVLKAREEREKQTSSTPPPEDIDENQSN